jgi:hypothetical protein
MRKGKAKRLFTGEPRVDDEQAELWYIYQQLLAALRTGNAAKLQGTARSLVDRIGERFQTRSRSVGKPGP